MDRALRLSALGCISFLFFAGLIRAQKTITDSGPRRPELVLQTGHTTRINCVAFGPEGKWLASGGADNQIKLWDVASGRELRSLNGHTGWIKSLAVSSDGLWLASGSNDRTIKVWNVTTGMEVRNFTGHTAPIESLAFSFNGRWLASGSADGIIRIWDLSTGKEMQMLKGHVSFVTALAFTTDGRALISGGMEGTVVIWDTTSWNVTRRLEKELGRITSVAVSADLKWLAAGSLDGQVFLWELASLRQQVVFSRPSSVLAIAFAPDGMLLAGWKDGTAKGWSLTGRKETSSVEAGVDSYEAVALAFSADGRLLASGSGNRTIGVRDLTGKTASRTLESNSAGFYAVAFSDDGRWLASGSNDRSVRLWQTATGREMPRLLGHNGWVATLAFSSDSRLLASGSISGGIKIWDVTTSRAIRDLKGHTGSVNSVAFSPDGKWLVSGGSDQALRVWNLADGREARTLSGHTGEVTTVAFTRDGRLLGSGSLDKTIRLWDVTTGTTLATLENPAGQINAIAFSSDNLWLAAGGDDRTVTLWDLRTRRAGRALTGHAGDILAVAFSKDGRRLASAATDQTAKVWDVQTGKEENTLRGHSANVNSVHFSSDSHWLVSASEDGSMLVWDAASGARMATLLSMRDGDEWLVVTPDGLFDGSPASWNRILWRFDQSSFKVAPVEAFFSEYYYPGLLAEIFRGKAPRATQDISQKDRRQPQIKLTLAGARPAADAIATRNVKITIAINDVAPSKEYDTDAGARDLRLFRNGLLVKSWPGDVLNARNQTSVEATIPIVAGENRLIAYAFNRDNVKSEDSALILTGSSDLKRTGTAYLLAIGVGQYANPEYNLNYSVADAEELGAQLRSQQESLGRYQPVEVIPLLNREATKANILLALKRLAGTETGELPPGAPLVLAKIKPAQPEDAVIVYFSGHGTAQKDHFYLIPHDIGYQGSRTALDAEGLREILAHSVSDSELEETLRSVDADQLLLVIDACNSGQALEAAEKRRGPMNTRGLAQLAYEKGMYILTASQSMEVAFESEALKHSYLTYALVEEGIKGASADLDRNGDVSLSEWFDYAAGRVPQLGRQKKKQGKQLEESDPDEVRVQRPRMFYSRDAGAQRLVIARFSTARSQ
ncbi:MAG TPA: caspase family protein [Pyrinomonadaceae bacterium]|jgi:WD40 repeat protein